MEEVNVVKPNQPDCTRVICIIALVVFLTGCWAIPFHDTRDRAVQRKEVESLIGENEAAVIEKIGPSTHRITKGDYKYLVYEGRLDTYDLIFAFWIPVGFQRSHEEALDCLVLEFKNDVLQRYDIETRTQYYHMGRLRDCRLLLWSAEDIEQIAPLLGTSMAKVKNTFGEPHWVVQDKTNVYFVYQYSHPLSNACVLLGFDDQYTLRRYEIKSCGLFGEDCPTHPAGEIEWGRLDCRQLFWSLDQLQQMGTEEPEG
jgi:hypothetical protein